VEQRGAGRQIRRAPNHAKKDPRKFHPMDKQGEEDLWQRHKAERGVWSEGMLAALEQGVKGNKWFSLIDKVYADRTLALAWAKVKSNDGASGVDGITVGLFDLGSPKRLLAVKEHIMEGSYQPKPVKRVWIPKLGSWEKRPLGIPTVLDRVVQTALRMVIEPIFEREFAAQSYGFRPGRGCKDALRRVDELLQGGLVHVVEIDIRGYFDAIPRERLMERVREHVADGRVLALIEAFLKQGVMEGMESWETETGTPQGGVISPLLANIYLNPLDWLMERAGLEMVRYADDMVVLCREPETAERALGLIRQWMQEAGLELHPEKTRIVAMTEARGRFDFLGYRFWRGKKGNLLRFSRPKSVKKMHERLKPLTRRTNGRCLSAIIQTVNPILRGWYGYFKHASEEKLNEMDGWLRGRLRSILRKRRKGKGRGRGRDHQRWNNRYFAKLGLFCLEAARAEEIASLRSGANC
jgi:RNA-directed DNA polymerase